jgi:hypothetical protein
MRLGGRALTTALTSTDFSPLNLGGRIEGPLKLFSKEIDRKELEIAMQMLTKGVPAREVMDKLGFADQIQEFGR